MHRRTAATLIACLVTLSVLGALPGGATPTADDTRTAIEADGPLPQLAGADANLHSGNSYWQGWTLGLDASGFLAGDDRTIEVWSVTEDGQLSHQVRTADVDEDGLATVGTNRLNGRYVLRYGGNPVYVHEGTGYLADPPDGSDVTVESSAFRVEPQTLTAEPTDPEVFPGQGTTLTVESNRGRTVVAISGEGLSFSDLETLLPESAYAENHDARAPDDELLVEVSAATDLPLTTSGLEPGTQELAFSAVDTSARERVSLTLKQPASDRRFVSIEANQQVGDVFEAELACTNCHLAVGTPEQGVLDLVELTDTDGDGRITLRINTRYVGGYPGHSGYPDGVNPYTAENAEVRRYGPGTELEQVDEELSYTIDTLGKLRDQLGLDATGRVTPVEPGRLHLTVASTDFLINRSAYGDRPPYGSQLVIRDETDARTVELEPRSLDGVQSMAAPDRRNFEATADGLRDEAGPRDRVALGDRLVFRVDLTGVFGYLDVHGVSLDTLDANEDEGLDVMLHRLDGGTESIPLDRVNVQVAADPSADHLYVVFGTGEARNHDLVAGEYRLTFALEGVASSHGAYSSKNAHEGYPYLDAGARETASTTVRLEPASATITSPEVGSSPRLTSDNRLAIEGTATVAAGTTLRVHVASTEFAWETADRATVGELGGWSAAPNLADAPGDEFNVTVTRDGEALAGGTFTVRPPLEGGATDDGTDGGGSGDGSGDGAGGDGGGAPGLGGGGGSFIPGIPNLAIYGGGFLAVVVALFLWRLSV